MDKQTLLGFSRLRQAVTYVLMSVGLALLIALGMQGIKQINDKQVVEGKPYQVLAAESNHMLTGTTITKDMTGATIEPVDEPLVTTSSQPQAASNDSNESNPVVKRKTKELDKSSVKQRLSDHENTQKDD